MHLIYSKNSFFSSHLASKNFSTCNVADKRLYYCCTVSASRINQNCKRRNCFMKIMLLLSALCLCFTLRAEVKICAHCGKGSKRMLYSAENKFFCSRQCAKAKFSCSHCGQIPKGRYMMILGTTGQYKRFCNSCSQMKKCFSCHFPISLLGRRYTSVRVTSPGSIK